MPRSPRGQGAWDFHTTVLSPDGHKLSRSLESAYLSDPNSTETGRFDLVDLDSGEVTWAKEFANLKIQRHAWSPDGQWIATRLKDSLSQNSFVQLLHPASGKIQALLLHDPEDRLGTFYRD